MRCDDSVNPPWSQALGPAGRRDRRGAGRAAGVPRAADRPDADGTSAWRAERADQVELVQTFRFQVRLSRSLPGRRCSAADLAGGAAIAARRRRVERSGPVPHAAPVGGTRRGRRPLGDGGFAECSGLELEADVKEYLEGGRNDGVVRRVGRVKLVADRAQARHVRSRRRPPGQRHRRHARCGTGCTARWSAGEAAGPAVRRRGRGPRPGGRARRWPRWTFERGLPLKVDRADAERQDR